MIRNNIKLRLTAMSGNTKDIYFQTREQVENFINELPNELGSNQRVKITCDILGIDGYLMSKSVAI